MQHLTACSEMSAVLWLANAASVCLDGKTVLELRVKSEAEIVSSSLSQ